MFPLQLRLLWTSPFFSPKFRTYLSVYMQETYDIVPPKSWPLIEPHYNYRSYWKLHWTFTVVVTLLGGLLLGLGFVLKDPGTFVVKTRTFLTTTDHTVWDGGLLYCSLPFFFIGMHRLFRCINGEACGMVGLGAVYMWIQRKCRAEIEEWESKSSWHLFGGDSRYYRSLKTSCFVLDKGMLQWLWVGALHVAKIWTGWARCLALGILPRV